MKLRRILLIFAAAVLLCTAVCAGDYKDVADTHWASEQIAYLSDEITGYPDGTFQPDKTVTRAEFVSLLARIAFPEELCDDRKVRAFNCPSTFIPPYRINCKTDCVTLPFGTKIL